MKEFEEACLLISKHSGSSLGAEDIKTIASSIDHNNDGEIDFNEFLEAFRIVDNVGREWRKRRFSEPNFSPGVASVKEEADNDAGNSNNSNSSKLIGQMIPSFQHVT